MARPGSTKLALSRLAPAAATATWINGRSRARRRHTGPFAGLSLAF